MFINLFTALHILRPYAKAKIYRFFVRCSDYIEVTRASSSHRHGKCGWACSRLCVEFEVSARPMFIISDTHTHTIFDNDTLLQLVMCTMLYIYMFLYLILFSRHSTAFVICNNNNRVWNQTFSSFFSIQFNFYYL